MAERGQLIRVRERAVQELGRLLGSPAERVTGLHRSEAGWTANVEVLELHRVPETSDVLADYEVDLTREGEILGYRRTRRYLRSEAEGS